MKLECVKIEDLMPEDSILEESSLLYEHLLDLLWRILGIIVWQILENV